MEVKRFGNPAGKKVLLLHGNLMCWRQFDDVIPLPETEFDVYAVSFDSTGKTTYTTAQEQASKLEDYLIQNCGGTLDLLFAESLGCGPVVCLRASRNVQIRRMILSGPDTGSCQSGIGSRHMEGWAVPVPHAAGKPAGCRGVLLVRAAGGAYEKSNRKAAAKLPKADGSVLSGFWTRGHSQPSNVAC